MLSKLPTRSVASDGSSLTITTGLVPFTSAIRRITAGGVRARCDEGRVGLGAQPLADQSGDCGLAERARAQNLWAAHGFRSVNLHGGEDAVNVTCGHATEDRLLGQLCFRGWSLSHRGSVKLPGLLGVARHCGARSGFAFDSARRTPSASRSVA